MMEPSRRFTRRRGTASHSIIYGTRHKQGKHNAEFASLSSWAVAIAGLAIASKLKRTAGRIPIAVSLIDREPAYVWKLMQHAIAAGTSDFSRQETNYIAQARDRHFVFHPS